MSDWLLNLPVPWMALVVFVATYLIAGGVYFIVTNLAVNERARAFKAVSPGMLPPLGILFALLVGFIAVEVWSNFDKAKAAVATEASALRAVVLLAGTFPDEQKARIDALINRHIEEAVNNEWPEMAKQRATLSTLPKALIEALHDTLALKPADDSQRTAQPEMVKRSIRRWMRGASALLSANLPSARLNGPGFCFKDFAPWSPLPWFIATTGSRAP
jgi:hypothetical protein